MPLSYNWYIQIEEHCTRIPNLAKTQKSRKSPIWLLSKTMQICLTNWQPICCIHRWTLCKNPLTAFTSTAFVVEMKFFHRMQFTTQKIAFLFWFVVSVKLQIRLAGLTVHLWLHFVASWLYAGWKVLSLSKFMIWALKYFSGIAYLLQWWIVPPAFSLGSSSLPTWATWLIIRSGQKTF